FQTLDNLVGNAGVNINTRLGGFGGSDHRERLRFQSEMNFVEPSAHAFGQRRRRPKGRGNAVKDDRTGGAPGLHKRRRSAEDWGGGRSGRMARSLTAWGILPLET